MGDRKSLSDLLREESLLDEEALQAATRRAHRQGVPLVVAVLEEGRVSEAQVLDALARRLKLPRVDPGTTFIEVDAVREVTWNLAATHCLLPIALERQAGRRVLRVAMADPLDHEAVDEIEQTTGCHVEAVLAAPSSLAPAIERAYRGVVTKLIPRGGPNPPTLYSDAEPSTQPHHRLEDEAPVDVRLRALVALLVEKSVISEDEYAEAIRRILKNESS